MQSYRLILDTPIPKKVNFSIVKMEGNIAEFDCAEIMPVCLWI
jgi:hypothetical protein